MNKRYCMTLDLKNDPELMGQYEAHHRAVWPEVLSSIRDAGIEDMEIYRMGNRLFMVMEVNSSFSFEKKAQADQQNPVVQQWEQLMWTFQQPLPGSAPGEKWMLMQKIFDLDECEHAG